MTRKDITASSVNAPTTKHKAYHIITCVP